MPAPSWVSKSLQDKLARRFAGRRCTIEGEDVRALYILLGLFAALMMPAKIHAASLRGTQRSLYAVNEPASDRGSISVYDIDAAHRLVKKSLRFRPLPMLEEWRPAR
jgi:hypothetical protein